MSKVKGTLMEVVNKCKTIKVDEEKLAEAKCYGIRLDKLGFKEAANQLVKEVLKRGAMRAVSGHGYVCISPDRIKAFLRSKANDYNYNAGMKDPQEIKEYWARYEREWNLGAMLVDPETGARKFEAPTVHVGNNRGIGRFCWIETPVANYKGVPPSHVIDRLEDAVQKNVFTSFTVATVEGVKDPLLLGVCKGSDERFFIAQWGDDVSLDDLI